MVKIKIGQDYGHGGKDSGARGSLFTEKELALRIGKKVSDILSKHKEIKVFESRKVDRYVSLRDRSNFFNKNKVDIVISYHLNSFHKKNVNGFESFIFSGKVSSNTKRLQNVIHKATVKSGLFKNDRGRKRKNLHMVRETQAPSVLLELGFISNKDEEKKVSENINKLAEHIASGILQYFNLIDKPIKDNSKKPPKKINALDYESLANDVILGKHGNGHETRRKSLGLTQSDYERVKEIVNRKIGKQGKKKNNFNKQVHEVLIGKHGNGHETRRKSLGVSKAEYGKIRKEVNRILSN